MKLDGAQTQSSEETMQTWVEHFKTLLNPTQESLAQSVGKSGSVASDSCDENSPILYLKKNIMQ